MKISIATLVAVLLASADAATVSKLTVDATSKTITIASAGGSCASNVYYVATSGGLCLDKDLVNVAKSGSPATAADVRAFVAAAGGVYKHGHTVVYESELGADNLKNIVKNIPKDNIPAYTTDAAFIYLMPHLSDAQMKKAMEHYATIGTYFTASSAPVRAALTAALNNMSDGVISKHRGAIATWITSTGLEDLSSKVAESLMKAKADDGDCTTLNAAAIALLQEDPAVAQTFTYSCLSQVPDMKSSNAYCKSSIQFWPLEIFKKGIDINTECFKHLKADQLAAYHANIDLESGSPCTSVPLEDYLKFNGSKMTPICFAHAFKGYSAGTLKDAWTFLPPNIFSEILEDDHEKVGTLTSDDWMFISAEQKSHLFKNDEVCGVLTKESMDHHNHMTVPTDCFLKMPAVPQAIAFVESTLDDKALEKLETIADWEYGGKKGIEVLDEAQYVHNVANLIRNMSSHKEISQHICSLIDNFETLLKSRLIQAFGSKECFAAMGDEIVTSLNELVQLDDHVREFIPLDKFIKNMTTAQYAEMDAEKFTKVADILCCHINREAFDALSSDVKNNFPSNCVNQLTFDLTAAELKGLSADAFNAVTKDAYAKFPAEIEWSDDQWAAMGKGISDPAQHPASAWTVADVVAITANRAGKMHAHAVAAVPAEAYSGLNKDAFAALEAEAITPFTFAQLNSVSTEARALLSAKQAEVIGQDAKFTSKEEDHPLLAFKDVKLAENVRTIVDHRLKA